MPTKEDLEDLVVVLFISVVVGLLLFPVFRLILDYAG
jgi:hypothetical protein